MKDIPPKAATLLNTAAMILKGEWVALQFEVQAEGEERRWTEHYLMSAANCRKLAERLIAIADMIEKGGKRAN